MSRFFKELGQERETAAERRDRRVYRVLRNSCAGLAGVTAVAGTFLLVEIPIDTRDEIMTVAKSVFEIGLLGSLMTGGSALIMHPNFGTFGNPESVEPESDASMISKGCAGE